MEAEGSGEGWDLLMFVNTGWKLSFPHCLQKISELGTNPPGPVDQMMVVSPVALLKLVTELCIREIEYLLSLIVILGIRRSCVNLPLVNKANCEGGLEAA